MLSRDTGAHLVASIAQPWSQIGNGRTSCQHSSMPHSAKNQRRKNPRSRAGRRHRRAQEQDAEAVANEPNSDYQLLLTAPFAAMTRITDHLFLTGVGGMTRDNFRRNHIDFVVNITTEAPLWEDTETMRVPVDDDHSANILAYLDQVVDRIHEAIQRRGAHVLVHCVAGVSRSATIVIAYLMKHRRLDLRSAFNHCFSLRPVIRPNNGFMTQLIAYEQQLFGRASGSTQMVELEHDGATICVPNFFVQEHPQLLTLESLRVKEQQRQAAVASGQAAATRPEAEQ